MKISPLELTNMNDSVAIRGLGEDLDEDEEGGQALQHNVRHSAISSISIKTCLIVMISILIFSSICILSAIWIGCFSPTVTQISAQVRDGEFSKIVSFSQQTISEIIMVVETVKTQLSDDAFSITNFSQVEDKMYKVYRSEFLQFHSELVVTLFMGSPFGWINGIVKMDGLPYAFNLTSGLPMKFYQCHNISTEASCKKNAIPDYVFPPYGSSVVPNTARKNPGHGIFTLSYADQSLPSITFVTYVTSWALNNASSMGTPNTSPNYLYHLGYDMSVQSISKHLTKITNAIEGAVAFIIEMETGYIISSDVPNAKIATWDEKGQITRTTPFTIEDERTRQVARFVYDSYSNNLKNGLKCNSNAVLTSSERYVSTHRYCTESGIDWLLVFSVPQWNYLNSMAIAIISAMLSGLVIIGISIVLAIVLSVRIVSPFRNLINSFESISNMDLENVFVSESRFAEEQQLQRHFLNMVSKMKQYRSFLPSHLLLELEGRGGPGAAARTSSPHGSRNESPLMRSITTTPSVATSIQVLGASFTDTASVGGGSGSGEHGQNNAPKARFKLYLEKRPVSALSIHLEGLNYWLTHFNEHDVVQLLSDFFEQSGNVCRVSSGLMGAFDNGSLVMYFNATSNQANHEDKAISACLTILHKLQLVLESKWKLQMDATKYEELKQHFKVRASACFQETFAGNLGTKFSKNFTVLGSIGYNLDTLLQVAKDLDLSLVVCENLLKECAHFQTRYIDSKLLIAGNCYSKPWLYEHSRKDEEEEALHVETRIYEVGHSSQHAENEWMYELAEQEKKGKWNLYNQACQFLFANEYEMALQLFVRFKESLGVDDRPTERLIQKCQAALGASNE